MALLASTCRLKVLPETTEYQIFKSPYSFEQVGNLMTQTKGVERGK